MRELSVSSSIFFFAVLLLFLDVHDDGMLDEVGELLDDLRAAGTVEKLLGVVLEVQDDIGAARGFSAGSMVNSPWPSDSQRDCRLRGGAARSACDGP